MIQKYTEHDRQKIAAREYTEYTKDDPIDIGTDKNRKNQWKSVSG